MRHGFKAIRVCKERCVEMCLAKAGNPGCVYFRLGRSRTGASGQRRRHRVSERSQQKDRLKYRLGLMSDLGSSLKRPDVDVVVLNEAPPLLAHRVLSKGILIFERSASARVRFQVQTASRYLDLIPMYETQIRHLKKGPGKDLG
jgi:hypothetical protein